MIAQDNSLPLNKETIYLIEALKVEGYWNSSTFSLTLQNKNLPFLNYIENIIKKFDITPYKRILLKIKLEDNTKKEDIKIYNKKTLVNFHIEKSPFDNKKVKAVTSLRHETIYLKLNYKNKNFKINIQPLKEEIKCDSSLKCWIYGDLRFPKKVVLNLLDKYGGDKKNLSLKEEMLNSNKEWLIKAFSALIDCEGSLDWYGFKRIIRVRMRSKNYLKQWSSILKKNNINNKFRKNKNEWELVISGWEDFTKLEKMGLELNNSLKAEKWKKIMRGFKRNQISRNTYKEFYVNKIKDFDNITAIELAEKLQKSKRVVNHYLFKLEKEGLLSRDKKIRPYRYFISTSSVR